MRLLLNNPSHEYELAVVSGLASLPKNSQICAVMLVPTSATSICITYKQTNVPFDSRLIAN